MDQGQLTRIECELDRVALDICELLLLQVDESVDQNYATDAVNTAKRPSHIKLISSLAEGADRLAFKAARFQRLSNIHLERSAILPFSREMFCGDFDAENSVVAEGVGTVAEFLAILDDLDQQGLGNVVTELGGDTGHRDEAYNLCSRTLVEASDLLIVVYDQKEYVGVGTAFTVECALERRVPVIHVPNSAGFTRLISVDQSGGRQTDEYCKGRLQGVLEGILS